MYGRLYDGTNGTEPASVDIKDEIAPNAPTISLNGTMGTDGWYKGTVTATIDAGTDGQSGTNKVRYKVTGAQTIEQTDTNAGTTSTSITISAEGTSTITAYTIDKAGNVSEEKTQVVNEDSTEPSTASISVTSYGETSISVNAKGADATSGVYSYAFQRSTTSSTSGFTTVATPTSTSTSYSYTYTGLADGTKYYLRVIVTDKAGNSKTGTAITQTTKTSYPTASSTLEEGDYVTYPSSQGNLACRVLYDSSSGYGVQLITSACPKSITLGSNNDFDGNKTVYNNVVSTLNTEAGKYNNSTYSTRARCVGSHPTSTSDTTSYYTRSESWFTSKYTNQFKDIDTKYETDYNQMETLGVSNTDRAYWLASRNVRSYRTDGTDSAFCVRIGYPSGGLLGDNDLCRVGSGGLAYAESNTKGLRPVFILKSDIKITGGTGESGSPYTLGV